MATLEFAQAFQSAEHEAFLWQGTQDIAVMLTHGFPGTPAEMRPLAQALHEQGLTVCAPLLPGFGREIDTLMQRTYHEWLTATEQQAIALKQSHRQVILLGHSMGGAISVHLAAKIQPTALILLAPFWQLNHILWQMLPVIRFVVPQFKPFRLFKPNFQDPAIREDIQRFLPQANLDDQDTQSAILNFSVSVNLFDQIRLVGENGAKATKNVTSPTLVIQGRQDELVTPAVTRQYIQRFPNAPQYYEIDGAHNLIDDHAPSWHLTKSHVLDFVQKIIG